MRFWIPIVSLGLAACAQTVPPVSTATSPPPEVQTARNDVERMVIERFGAPALARARGADEFLAALRYPGLPMPDHDTDGHPIKPSFPTALLFREQGRWYAYGIDGIHPMLPRWSAQLETLLNDPRLWAEPADGGVLGCTDAGASYVWLRIQGHPEQARVGHCGGSPLTEQLVSASFMG